MLYKAIQQQTLIMTKSNILQIKRQTQFTIILNIGIAIDVS